MVLGATVWVGLALAVAAVVMLTPRNKDEWYHKEAGYDKPYLGVQRGMGCTHTITLTGFLFAAAMGMFGWVFGNLVMMALAAGCFVLALAALGMSSQHDREDAAEDGIRVEYNQNGGIPGFLITVAATLILAAGVVVAIIMFG